MGETRHDLESLLSETGWVRSLARTLSRDSASADDLAQEAYARAIAAPPPAETPLRRWFALVIRNLAREQHRGEGRRAKRERAAAQAERIEAESALFERLEVHRELVEAVSRLDEPYRAVILLRYFEGLGPAAIAERTGVPIRTVHTRLSRALTRLREELDRSHGGRERWLLALVPFAAEPSRPVAAAIGALVMDAKIKVAIAAVAVAGVCATLAWRDDTPRSPESLALGAEHRIEVTSPSDSITAKLEGAAASGERRASEPAIAAANGIDATPATANVLHGCVIDFLGAPLGGLKIRIAGAGAGQDRAEIETGSDGRFTIEAPPKEGWLEVASPGYATVLRAELGLKRGAGDIAHWLEAAPAELGQKQAGSERVLVAAPAVDLAGVVVDEVRRPIGGARVSVETTPDLRARLTGTGWNLAMSREVGRQLRADDQGHFAFQSAPSFEGSKLSAMQTGFALASRPVPARDDLALEIVLRRSESDHARISGRVVDVTGSGVGGALVTLGGATAKSAGDGWFVLVSDEAQFNEVWGAADLQAAKQGYQPARLERRRAGEPWPEKVVLQLGPPPLTIRGRVVDAGGNAIAGASVFSPDEQPLGFVELADDGILKRTPGTAESVARGVPGFPGEFGMPRIRTDADGRFELRGLSTRDYRIVALDPRSLTMATASFAAGVENAEVRMPPEALHERVAGRVTSLTGEPLSGVTVAFERPLVPEPPMYDDSIAGASVETDADGRFEVRGLSHAADTAHLTGPNLDVGGHRRGISSGADVEHLVFAVPQLVHARIEGSAHAEYDRAALLDERERELPLTVTEGNSVYRTQRMLFAGGRTATFAVSETARTLVLYQKDEEVRRTKLELVRSQVNVIRP